jgi:hypothetical protein
MLSFPFFLPTSLFFQIFNFPSVCNLKLTTQFKTSQKKTKMQDEIDPCQTFLSNPVSCEYGPDAPQTYGILQPPATSRERIYGYEVVDCIPWTFRQTVIPGLQPTETFQYQRIQFPHHFPADTNETSISMETDSSSPLQQGALFISDIPIPAPILLTPAYNELVHNPNQITPPVSPSLLKE